MNATELTLVTSVYHLASSLIGLALGWMGYRLFRVGLFDKAGELKVAWGGGRSLVLKQAAPGTFFALLGAAIVIISLEKGFNLRTSQGPDGNIVTVGAAGGMSGIPSPNAQPLGAFLKQQLAEYAICIRMKQGTEEVCDTQLRSHLLVFPDSTILREVDTLESKPSRERGPEWNNQMTSLRQRILKQ